MTETATIPPTDQEYRDAASLIPGITSVVVTDDIRRASGPNGNGAFINTMIPRDGALVKAQTWVPNVKALETRPVPAG